MGKFQPNGIGWIDVMHLMTGLQGIHECTVEVHITAGTHGRSGLLGITVFAWEPTVESHHTNTLAELKLDWPNAKYPSLDSCVFNALYDLDREIGRQYTQQKLPG